MRRISALGAALVLVVLTAVPAAADHGEQIDGVWRARDLVDGSLMLIQITELSDGSGKFNVVFTDTRATGGCEPDAIFRAVSNSGEFDPGLAPSPHGPRFFVTFDVTGGDQILCLGRPSEPTIDFFELQFCFENDPVHCTDPVDSDPNIMIDLILDENEQPISSGNVWFHILG